MFTEVLVALVIGGLIYFLVWSSRDHVLMSEDGWWGAGPPPDGVEDITIRPFKITTSDKELEDLYRRIDHTRPVLSVDNTQFTYGFNSHYLEKLVKYWRNDFDWKKQIDQLNQYPHFITKIEGLDIHFLHVTPKRVPQGTTPIPLILVNSWPSSFYEFYKLIALLIQPSNPDDLVFEVVCPSLPGYAFSAVPHKKGLDSVCAGRIFHKLMKRLGFQQFYAHGGDLGWLVTTNMCQLEPKTIKGLHLNFAPPIKSGFRVALSILMGRRFPKLFGFTDLDIKRLYPIYEKHIAEVIKEFGYLHLQATKPDSLGRGLNDSPVGLAAYILEKFSTWTCRDFRFLEDGGLTKKFSLDELLTTVMIYWTTGSITSSMRFHRETFGRGINQTHSKVKVYVPTGFACFPDSPLHTTQQWVRQKYPNLVTFTIMPRGGHFPAMEEPQLLAEDIQNFIKIIERKNK